MRVSLAYDHKRGGRGCSQENNRARFCLLAGVSDRAGGCRGGSGECHRRQVGDNRTGEVPGQVLRPVVLWDLMPDGNAPPAAVGARSVGTPPRR